MDNEMDGEMDGEVDGEMDRSSVILSVIVAAFDGCLYDVCAGALNLELLYEAKRACVQSDSLLVVINKGYVYPAHVEGSAIQIAEMLARHGVSCASVLPAAVENYDTFMEQLPEILNVLANNNGFAGCQLMLVMDADMYALSRVDAHDVGIRLRSPNTGLRVVSTARH